MRLYPVVIRVHAAYAEQVSACEGNICVLFIERFSVHTSVCSPPGKSVKCVLGEE